MLAVRYDLSDQYRCCFMKPRYEARLSVECFAFSPYYHSPRQDKRAQRENLQTK